MDSNLRNNEYFEESQKWEYIDFNDCFPLGIRMGDIDGSIIWNNETLFTDFKHPNAKGQLNDGQRLMYGRHLAKGNTTIILVEGEVGKPQRIKIGSTFGISKDEIDLSQPYWTDWTTCDGIDDLKRIYKRWSKMAQDLPTYMYDVPRNLKP